MVINISRLRVFTAGSYVALTLLGRPPGTPQKVPGGGGGPLPDPVSPTSPGPVQHSPTSPIERTTASDRISGPRKVDVSIRSIQWGLCSTATLHSTVRPLLDGHSTQYSGASVRRSLRTIQSAQYRGTLPTVTSLGGSFTMDSKRT